MSEGPTPPVVRRWTDDELSPRLDQLGADRRGMDQALLDGSHLVWLQGWYAGNCDGDWEHGYGVDVATRGGQGWDVTFDLSDTYLSGIAFSDVRTENGASWLHAWIEDDQFRCHCGPLDLGEAIFEFRTHARRHAINGQV